MAEVGFYHLTRSTLAQALPKLLLRTLGAGHRALILAPDAADVAALNEMLWAQPDWLPHGSVVDGDPDLQPIWLTTEPEPANGARYLFLVEGAATDRLDRFERAFDLFDGTASASIEAARGRWTSAKAAGHGLTYWQQGDAGWRKKA